MEVLLEVFFAPPRDDVAQIVGPDVEEGARWPVIIIFETREELNSKMRRERYSTDKIAIATDYYAKPEL